ncbi:hypothetical protein DFH07DRAFT_956893 [Mycena maculata]|uniref:Uncharacterized protein n=1 Tax=Mycena maculata TaxID=230809 RepID=A0AAD7NJ68_9AGAR|nr:hypothetical protein DFH07DRAFT_956893 [Mycena maculata]
MSSFLSSLSSTFPSFTSPSGFFPSHPALLSVDGLSCRKMFAGSDRQVPARAKALPPLSPQPVAPLPHHRRPDLPAWSRPSAPNPPSLSPAASPLTSTPPSAETNNDSDETGFCHHTGRVDCAAGWIECGSAFADALSPRHPTASTCVVGRDDSRPSLALVAPSLSVLPTIRSTPPSGEHCDSLKVSRGTTDRRGSAATRPVDGADQDDDDDEPASTLTPLQNRQDHDAKTKSATDWGRLVRRTPRYVVNPTQQDSGLGVDALRLGRRLAEQLSDWSGFRCEEWSCCLRRLGSVCPSRPPSFSAQTNAHADKAPLVMAPHADKASRPQAPTRA